MTIHLITAGKYQDEKTWPEIWVKCFNSLAKTKNNICVWNDEGIEKLLKEDDNEFYNEYLSKLDPIYSWDYVRYIILEKYGGTYFDMDIELTEEFFNKLDQNKIYMMEGTRGTYIENSIMISPQGNFWASIWERIKLEAQKQIKLNFPLLNKQAKVIDVVGANMLSTFFSKWVEPYLYDILGYYHFGNVNSTLSYTKHHQTSLWNNTK